MGSLEIRGLVRSRTLPRVRELKLGMLLTLSVTPSRTLPRVRELKHLVVVVVSLFHCVAPFPGCVN